jgi:anti-anti-sigma factor
MHLEITHREREGIVLVDMKGRLTAGQAVSAMRDVIEGHAKTGAPKLVLNLREVDYIDSTGLGALVYCYTNLTKVGGAAKLLNLNRRNLELIVLTKIDTIFEVFNDETDAVNSSFPGRTIKRFDILSFVRQMKDQ